MAENSDSMPKEDRRKQILEFFDEHEVLLPPTPLHVNLVEYQDVTFSKKTTRRLCKELSEEGLLQYVDEGKGYYRITPEGRAYLQGEQE